ncbi:MAG: sodium:solute symporter family protein [Mycobacteriaceae bacterium]|uniref:sodium:solute symporter family protein n=1 Tax=Corynebacterium sp. TaxID=1720 RepID=UPI003F9AA15F
MDVGIIAIVVVYMAAMIGVGLYARTKIKDSEDYHLAGRRLGVVMLAGTLAATEIGGGSSVGVAERAYGDWGLSAGWYVVSAGIALVLVSFVAPAMRRSMATTVPQVIGNRYGTASQVITATLALVAMVALTAVQITATATIVSVLGGLNFELAIIITGVIVVFYTWLGGMWSVTLTDFIQFFIIIFGFALAVPFAINNAGGWDTITANLPEGQLGFTKIGWPTIIGLIIMYTMTFSTGQEAVQRYYSARSPKVAVRGSLLAGVLMALYAFIPAILGLVALAVYPDIEGNNALATVATGLLPTLMAGLLLSAVMSATLSSASGDMLGAASIFVKDLLPRVKKDVTATQELKISRWAVIISGAIATLISLGSQAIIPLLIFAFTMRSAGPFSAYIFALMSRRTSRRAGLVSIILGTIGGVGWQLTDSLWGIDPIIIGGGLGLLSFLLINWIDGRRGNLSGDERDLGADSDDTPEGDDVPRAQDSERRTPTKMEPEEFR